MVTQLLKVSEGTLVVTFVMTFVFCSMVCPIRLH